MTAAVLDTETPVPPTEWIGALALADRLGLSYRQLDYACRMVPELGSMETMAGGSGSRRAFTADTVLRLAVAGQLAAAVPMAPRGSHWIVAVRAVMAGQAPPARGFALMDPDGEVRYFSRTLDLDDVKLGPVGTVVRYDIDLANDFGLLAA